MGAIGDARSAMDVLVVARGMEHADVATAQSALASALAAAGQPSEAMEWHRLALRMRLAVLGESHVDVGNSRCSVAALCLRLKRTADARREFQLAADCFAAALGEAHAETVAAREAVASLAETERQTKGHGDPPWKRAGAGHPWSRWDSNM
jgi:hypothetical protein